MAVRFFPFMACLVIRTTCLGSIGAPGWRALLSLCNNSQNYDGELLVVQEMKQSHLKNYVAYLNRCGFRSADNYSHDLSDYALILGPDARETAVPEWLEMIEVSFFDGSINPCNAFKLRDSNVHDLVGYEFKLNPRFPRKGYECDWPAYIGRIG